MQNAIVQIHYDNPSNIAGLTDSSGIRMYITDQLRQYDAGLMFFGINIPDVTVPAGKKFCEISLKFPGVPSYHMAGTCSQVQTSALTNTMNVFASCPHMHLLGKKFLEISCKFQENNYGQITIVTVNTWEPWDLLTIMTLIPNVSTPPMPPLPKEIQ